MDIVNWIGLLVAAGCFIYGIFRLWKAIRLLRKKAVSKSWVATTGDVIGKDIWPGFGHESGKTFTPHIKYTYTAGGGHFENTIYMDEKWRKASAKDALDEIGSTIQVWYNPENPEEHITTQEKVTLGDMISIILIFFVSLFFMGVWIPWIR